MANEYIYVNGIIKRPGNPENQEQQYVVEAIDIQGLFEYLKTHITLNEHELEVKNGKLNIVVDNETKTYYTITFNYNGATYKGTQKLPTTTTSETISVQSGNQLGELPLDLIKKYTISWNQGDGDVIPTGGDTFVEHTLSGWYTSETGGSQINSSTTVTGNQTYYAQYNQSTGTLNQPSNTSGLRLTKDIKFYNGTNRVETIQAVVKFSEWDHDLSKFSINSDLTITAQYENIYRSKQKPQDIADTDTQKFVGWATEDGNPVDFKKDPEENYQYTSTEYYAIWEDKTSEEQLYLYIGTTKPTSLSEAEVVDSYPDERIYTNNSGRKSHIFVLTNSDKNVTFIAPSENSPITQNPIDTTTISGYKIFETAVGVANTKDIKIIIS